MRNTRPVLVASEPTRKPELESVDTCDLCSGRTFVDEFSAGEWTLRRCTNCDLVFTSPRLTSSALERLYSREYYDRAHVYLSSQLREPTADEVRLARSILRKGTSVNGRARSLDIGCGAGHTVEAFSCAGWAATGIDLNQRAVQEGRSRGLDLRTCKLEELTEEFDVISCFHVIEHLPSPRAFLRRCARALPVGGFLLIEVPDYGSRNVGLLKGQWPHLYPDIHLYQFTQTTLCKLIATEAFQVVSVRRWAGRAFLDSSSMKTGQSHGSDVSFRDVLFSLRHVIYWNPWARDIIRRIVWDVLKHGEFLRILALRTR